MKELIVEASARTGKSSDRIFRDAYAFAEVRVSKDFIALQFLKYVHEEIVPEVVEDYCYFLIRKKRRVNH